MDKRISRMAMALVLGVCVVAGTAVEAVQQRGGPRRDTYQFSPLHWAVRYSDMDTARDLARGQNLETRDAVGRTPLHIAAMFGLSEMVALLLERGADVNARDQWGVTPLFRLELMRRYRGWELTTIAAQLREAGGVMMDMKGLIELD